MSFSASVGPSAAPSPDKRVLENLAPRSPEEMDCWFHAHAQLVEGEVVEEGEEERFSTISGLGRESSNPFQNHVEQFLFCTGPSQPNTFESGFDNGTQVIILTSEVEGHRVVRPGILGIGQLWFGFEERNQLVFCRKFHHARQYLTERTEAS